MHHVSQASSANPDSKIQTYFHSRHVYLSQVQSSCLTRHNMTDSFNPISNKYQKTETDIQVYRALYRVVCDVYVYKYFHT